MREQLWNDHWEYWESSNEFAMRGKPEQTKSICIPHDAMLEKDAFKESVNGWAAGYRDGGVYHYRKKFQVPEIWRQKTTSLKFEGVYMNAFVYINGEFAGKCHYGYNTFYIYMDPFLKYGTENEIHVVVHNDGMPGSRWYSGGGIYRDVYLIQGGMMYIKQDSLKIKTEEADIKGAFIRVKFSVCGRLTATQSACAVIVINDPAGNAVLEDKVPFLLFENTEKAFEKRFFIADPELWWDQDPKLYGIRVHLYINQQEEDITETHFGIRTLSMDAQRGFRINGRPLKLKGACIHHDSGILGAASFEDAHVRQMTLLKSAGFNAVRMAHHPMGQAMLRACDKVGMYVMDETFDMWNISKNDFDYALYFEEDWKNTLDCLAAKDYNHPSVIMYSLGNEIPESGSDHGIELCHQMADYLRRLDPDRYITEGINGVFAAGDRMDGILQDVMDDLNAENTQEQINDFMTVMQDHLGRIMQHPSIGQRLELAAQCLDVTGYNYMASRYKMDREQYPNRVIVGSETYPPAITKEWDLITECNNVIGEFTWAGWDYLGETGVGIIQYAPGERRKGEMQFPNQLAYVGDFDITGFRRPMSYLRQIVFEKEYRPYIAVQDPAHYGQKQVKSPWILSDARSCWNWAGYEGKPIIIEVYSAADEVELFVNGSSYGRKKCGMDYGYRALFDVIYEIGTVETVAYCNKKAVGRYMLRSASKKRKLAITREKDWGDTLIYLNLLAVDENGILADDEFSQITVSVNGAELLGVGSGDYAPAFNYISGKTNLFQGRAQAILRRLPEKEKITVTVESSLGTVEFDV